MLTFKQLLRDLLDFFIYQKIFNKIFVELKDRRNKRIKETTKI